MAFAPKGYGLTDIYPVGVCFETATGQSVPETGSEMSDKRNTETILKRLSRLNGQVQGVTRMVQEDRYCVDVLTQTAAIRSALRAVERLIIEDHARTCMEQAIVTGDQDRQRAMFQEIVGLLEKVRD